MSHRVAICWCGLPSLPKRSTCSDAHAAGANKGRVRNYDRRCRCGKPALAKRATCSDACAEAARVKSPEKYVCGCGKTKSYHAQKCAVCREATRKKYLCWCGAPRLNLRATCSDACAAEAMRRASEAASTVGQRSESKRSRRRREARTKYRRKDKAQVIAQLHAEQGGLCAVCDRAEALVLDHCHRTGEPRMLLCVRCNAALGMMRESGTLLRSLACYAETICV
jgi:hypothetical protein